MDETLDPRPQGGLEEVAGALHIGGEDIPAAVQWQGRRGMHDQIGAHDGGSNDRPVPDAPRRPRTRGRSG